MPAAKKAKLSQLVLLHADPVASAGLVQLHYVYSNEPGITRKKHGKNFIFFGPDGQRITNAETLERIRKLAIPPAYVDVWICALANGHLQATGRAANGKKQYFYHPQWRGVRDVTKYSQMVAFGEKLPLIRDRIAVDMALPGLPREKILATVIRLLECTLIRVGNEQYAREHESYGLTTLTNQHVDVHGNQILFEFRGKSGKEWSLFIRDPKIARIIKKCACLPGYELFQYLDMDGNPQRIDSRDVNDYLKEITEVPLTAKCFRTWAGTVAAFHLFRQCTPCLNDSEAAVKRQITEVIRQVSTQLGNTVAVCRKNYIHPHVFDCYRDGSIHSESCFSSVAGLKDEEAATLNFLKKRLQQLASNTSLPAPKYQ